VADDSYDSVLRRVVSVDADLRGVGCSAAVVHYERLGFSTSDHDEGMRSPIATS